MDPIKKQASADETAEIERLKESLREEHDMYLRALADFENYRRRVERERGSAARAGKRELIISLLPVLDSFDRALQHIGDKPSPMYEGFLAIHRKLMSLLEAQGVTPFDSVGETFDPELHEAIGSVQSDEYEPGVVVDEVQRGYRWGDELLRPARVRVAE
ncbi:MAG: nucleotide exchange factor GrpE [Blastocatellia bacterium]